MVTTARLGVRVDNQGILEILSNFVCANVQEIKRACPISKFYVFEQKCFEMQKFLYCRLYLDMVRE